MAQLCLGCMKENNGEQICPHCGFDRASEQPAPFLPLGTVLQEENYLVGKKIDNNGEGPKYIGYSNTMHSPVMIHEFMPAGICGRAKGKTNVVIREGYEDKYKELSAQFLAYYRALARLRELSAINPILDIFSENGLCYIVEEAYEYTPFTEYIDKRGGSIEWTVARPLFMPLIAALETMHAAKIGHYAISPENLVVTSEGKLRLVNFGIDEIRRTGGFTESELMDGCAAIEQYNENGKLTEATDIYGFTATLFYALTGRLPENSDERKSDGKLPIPTSVFKRMPPHVVTALAAGLQVKASSRIQTFEEMRTQLSSAPTVKAMRQSEATRKAMQTEAASSYRSSGKKESVSGAVWAILSVMVCMLILLVAGIFWVNSNPDAFKNILFQNNTEEPSEVSEDSNIDPNAISIPSLIGQKYDEVLAKQSGSTEYTIIKANEEIFSDKYEEGTIVSQSPEQGLNADKGVTIVVTVSKGLPNRELPVISGQSLEIAVKALGDQGFIASGNYVASDSVEEGKVIGYENYNAGDKAPYGAKIIINISTGAATSGSNTTVVSQASVAYTEPAYESSLEESSAEETSKESSVQ